MSLIGALVGAFIATTGQLAITRATRRDRWADKFHQRCAQIYALERECDLAVAHILNGEGADRLDAWDFATRRIAEAEILLLTGDVELTRALTDLTTAGVRLSAQARAMAAGGGDQDQVQARRAEHAQALIRFAEASRRGLGVDSVLTRRRARRLLPPTRENGSLPPAGWPIGPTGGSGAFLPDRAQGDQQVR
ncbi:hypothetical protein ACRB68_30620 [Actinomadura sp. RB68]|uniref:Uncharacterized protein n=2 Tax=Actinomadura macrotermitis TaxID=2585200 RepID=A0A7K0BUY9_9ACTN|nr:hypothetical protein [Actinomadura macrotermitis]